MNPCQNFLLNASAECGESFRYFADTYEAGEQCMKSTVTGGIEGNFVAVLNGHYTVVIS